MVFQKSIWLLLFLFSWFTCIVSSVDAQVTRMDHSIEQALRYSPQLRALRHNHKAIEFDLKQARALYGPSLDLEVGYGLEQFSDDTTRQLGADPSDSDWNNKEEYTLKLIQKIYDGGETGRQVAIQKALLDSSNLLILNAADNIVLIAISAHLDVHRQRELVALAEKNFNVHQEIYQSLAQQEQAGAGSIADVTQAHARMARAQSTLFVKKADLKKAIANYVRVVGTQPDELAYAVVPEAVMPRTLEEALGWIEQKNPELLALNARIIEAGERVALARSEYKPKLNLELRSCYKDNVEADESWQNTNEALLMLRWNLFNGGQDKAGVSAALSRQYQRQSNRDDKLIILRDAGSAAWATYLSLKEEKKAYQEATTYSRKTFEAYLNQFSISKRDLLDVLSAENDYFQSASQLVTVSADEIIAAYQILKLTGTLQVPKDSVLPKYPDALSRLSQAIDLTAASHDVFPEHPPAPVNSPQLPVRTSEPPESTTPQEKIHPASISDRRAALCSIEIGPCINKKGLKKAIAILHVDRSEIRRTRGSGLVKFTRLLEGKYPSDKIKKRLEDFKKIVDSAFILPDDGQFALYAGSYHDPDRAHRHAKLLEQQQIKVTAVEAEVEMQGTILVVQQIDPHLAEAIAEQMTQLGLSTKVTTSAINELNGQQVAASLNPQ